METDARYSEAKKITLIGIAVTAFLSLIKIVGGYLFYSHALIADGVHSVADLFIDTMVLFASKYGSQGADESHPYGHRRIETAATLMLALLLIFAGIGIAWHSLDEIIHSSESNPEWLALLIALISILGNEGLFHYTRQVSKKIQSALLMANAWHHRSDAASSIVVTIGLLGSLYGFTHLDAIAAIIVGLMICKMGLDYGWNSVKELVDTAVAPKLLEKIKRIIQNVDGVERIHQLRSRLMGGDILIDVHILVSPIISVSEGHYIAQHVHQALLEQLTSVKDVVVHVDPEDDEISAPSAHLPSRKTLEERLLRSWQQQYPALQTWIIHYLDGKLCIDLIVNKDSAQCKALQAQIEFELKVNKNIQQIRILEEWTPG